MEISRFGPDDADRLTAYVELTNAVRAVDSPWVHPMTVREGEGKFRHGWDGEPDTPYLGASTGCRSRSARSPRASGTTCTWPGSASRCTRTTGAAVSARRCSRRSSPRPGRSGRTSVGTDGWDAEASRGFAARHGLEAKSRAVNRRQHLADVDWNGLEQLYAEALPHASAYELVRRVGRTPDDELEAVATMSDAINDAPTDDLDIEDEVVPAGADPCLRGRPGGRGSTLHRVFARHRETGELAGHTVVVVDGERPDSASSTTRRSCGATAATGWACCSRRT